MNAIASNTTSAGADPSESSRILRWGGLAGLGFAGGLFLQNAVLLAGAPLPSASLDEIASFYADGKLRVALAVALVAVNVPLILFFVAAVARWFESDEMAAVWGRVASGSVVLLAALFGCATFLQATLAASVQDLAASPVTLRLLWDMHTAAFAVVGAALGTLLVALALGARRVGLVPTWTVAVGLLGAALLFAGAFASVPTVEGAPTVWLNVSGFLAWILFLVTTSFLMLRRRA